MFFFFKQQTAYELRISDWSDVCSSDLQYVSASHDIDVKVYGRTSGYIQYRRTVNGVIEKTYVDFSNDGQQIYSGSERMQANTRGRSTYTAQIKLAGSTHGAMDLKMTFGTQIGRAPSRERVRPYV